MACDALQVVINHDIDSAMEMVLANAGEDFRQHVKKWGAVHADPERYRLTQSSAPHDL